MKAMTVTIVAVIQYANFFSIFNVFSIRGHSSSKASGTGAAHIDAAGIHQGKTPTRREKESKKNGHWLELNTALNNTEYLHHVTEKTAEAFEADGEWMHSWDYISVSDLGILV